jgi:hypothetical protein
MSRIHWLLEELEYLKIETRSIDEKFVRLILDKSIYSEFTIPEKIDSGTVFEGLRVCDLFLLLACMTGCTFHYFRKDLVSSYQVQICSTR